MIRPLLPILCSLISGILLGYYLETHQVWGEFSSFGVLILAYAVLLCLWYGSYRAQWFRLATILLFGLGGLIGLTRYVMVSARPVHHISYFVDQEPMSGKTRHSYTIEGWLYKPPEYAEEKQYLYVATTWLEKGDLRYRVCGKVQITLTNPTLLGSHPKTLIYGDTIRARLPLYVPKNFSDFNYREFLRRQGIYLLGSLQHERNVIRLHPSQGNLVLIWIDRLRNRIVRVLDHYPSTSPRDHQAIQIIKAITLGKSRELASVVSEQFRNAGMYHLLVVSGIHIGILAWGVHQLLNLIHLPLRYRGGLITAVLLVYAGLTGFQFPVLRAVLMAVTLYLSITCNRIPDSLYSLAFAVGVILVIFPFALFEVSLQLTVAATASILLFVRLLQQYAFWERLAQLPTVIRLPILNLVITFGAIVGISPLTAFYFQQIYPYSLISNLLVLPLISLLLPISLGSNIFALVLPGNLVYPLLSVNVFLAKCFLYVTELFPKFDMIIPRPSLLLLLLYYLAVYSVCTVPRRIQHSQPAPKT